MRTIDLGTEFVGHFPLFEPDGVTKRSGVSSFRVYGWRDGAEAAVSASVSEIGDGEYALRATMEAAGAWSLEVYSPETLERWGEDFVVAQIPLEWGFAAADDNTVATFSVWFERDGARRVDVERVAAAVRGADGGLVVDLGTDAAPTGEGVFTFACPSVAIPSGAEYYLDATATRGAAVWYNNLGFAKV